MAQIITNQASLVYQFNGQTASALSNVATTTLVEPLSVSKNSLETTYGANDELTFIVSFTNSGATTLTNVSVVDDLGTYALGTNNVTPLTFVPNAVLFINGVFSGNIVPTQNVNSVTFTVPSLPAGASARKITTLLTAVLSAKKSPCGAFIPDIYQKLNKCKEIVLVFMYDIWYTFNNTLKPQMKHELLKKGGQHEKNTFFSCSRNNAAFMQYRLRFLGVHLV